MARRYVNDTFALLAARAPKFRTGGIGLPGDWIAGSRGRRLVDGEVVEEGDHAGPELLGG